MKLDAERHRTIKGQIMAILAKEYPGGTELSLLRRVLATIGIPLTQKELYGYIVYLRDIGYLSTKEVDFDGDEIWDILYFAATPKGLNFVDGNIPPDPGVARFSESESLKK